MATWQLGGLPSMAPQNDNAPRSSVPQPVQYQQQPNVGLMALQGLSEPPRKSWRLNFLRKR